MMTKRKQKQRKSESPESLATVMLGDMIPAATKKPSRVLERKISVCASNFKKLADSIKDALEQGRKEGFSDKEIGKMIKSRMLQAGFDRNTVIGYLPQTAKYKPRGNPSKGATVSQNNRLTGVTNNGEHKKTTKETEELEPQEEEQQQEESQEIWQTKVEDYNIHEVERYDRLFLIQLVHYLHDRLKKREASKQ